MTQFPKVICVDSDGTSLYVVLSHDTNVQDASRLRAYLLRTNYVQTCTIGTDDKSGRPSLRVSIVDSTSHQSAMMKISKLLTPTYRAVKIYLVRSDQASADKTEAAIGIKLAMSPSTGLLNRIAEEFLGGIKLIDAESDIRLRGTSFFVILANMPGASVSENAQTIASLCSDVGLFVRSEPEITVVYDDPITHAYELMLGRLQQ